MLTIKEIKQAVEYADGFEIQGCVIVLNKELYYDIQRFSNGMSEGYYDLFLDRVIHGINRDKDYPNIFQSYNWIEVVDIESDPVRSQSFNHNGITLGIREAREMAIRFVLEEEI